MSAGFTATRLCGSQIIGSDGKPLGRIEDIMIAADDGCVLYLVVAVGGVLGVGERLFAMPWHATRCVEDGQLHAAIRLADLEGQPGFDKDHWPDGPDPLFSR